MSSWPWPWNARPSMRALVAEDASDASLPRSVIMKRLVMSRTWPTTSNVNACMNWSQMPCPVMSTSCTTKRSAARPTVTPAPIPAFNRGSRAIR